MNIILNRLCIEPHLGMGYPTDNFPFLEGIHQYVQEGDLEALKFDFDFNQKGCQKVCNMIVNKVH